MSHELPPFDTKTVREWVSFQREHDPIWQTMHNGAVQISLRTIGIAAGATYYYGLRVPAGRVFVLFSRHLTLTQGRYHIDVATPAGGFTGGTPALIGTLRAGATPTVQTEVFGGVTPSGAITVLTNGFVDNGVGLGSSASSGSTADDGVLKAFGEGSALLRVEQTPSGDPWASTIELIGWELDATA